MFWLNFEQTYQNSNTKLLLSKKAPGILSSSVVTAASNNRGQVVRRYVADCKWTTTYCSEDYDDDETASGQWDSIKLELWNFSLNLSDIHCNLINRDEPIKPIQDDESNVMFHVHTISNPPSIPTSIQAKMTGAKREKASSTCPTTTKYVVAFGSSIISSRSSSIRRKP